MLADGYTTRQGPRGAYVHHDAVHNRLRERRGARMTALTSGGTIPETGDYTVMLEPQAQKIGTVNEDFAVESIAGDVFQLGNTSYRILKVEPGRVRVEDARGAAPNIPFWLGEAPGRSAELSLAVGRLREHVATALSDSPDAALRVLMAISGVAEAAAQQIVDYLAAAHRALGVLPTQQRIVIERFFDASGGMQLVLHAPFGSRLNRAWGLALRKRFCRQFNFELQAAATEDAIVLSLSTSHSFALDEVARYLRPATALNVLVQAVLDAPLFAVRWRWNATTALALPRFVGGRKVAPQLQRMKSEDLLASVFPDLLACAENLAGEREIPDHPLVAQTMVDCLYDAMDAAGWLQLLQRLESGEVIVVARDLPAPSPLAVEALQARPYAYLDDAPIEERRTHAVQNRRYGETPGSVDDMGRLDIEAIHSVRQEAWPEARSVDEMHEALMSLGLISEAEADANSGWEDWLTQLAADRRATRLMPQGASSGLWVAAERLTSAQAVYAGARLQPAIASPASTTRPPAAAEAMRDLLRSRLGGLGPVTAAALGSPLHLSGTDVEAALAALRTEGTVFEGHITPGLNEVEWCERHLLARIHRYTLNRLRREIEPVEPRDFVRFVFEWQHVGASAWVSGREALPAVLGQLEGFEAPAALWEAELLPSRVQDYQPSWLDELCTAGRTVWARLRPTGSTVTAGTATATGRSSLRATPVLLLPRRSLPGWRQVALEDPAALSEPSARAQRVLDHLEECGASFFDEMASGARLLRSELADALAELVARGRVHCDSYAGLRALLLPAAKRAAAGRQRRRVAGFGIEDAGRWTVVRATTGGSTTAAPGAGSQAAAEQELLEHVARTLLRRWGVVCWRLLEREAAWLPPWRDLVRVYRKLEARGDVRGGRFIAGVSGEQFALPDAIGALRQVRRQPPDAALVCLSASDPANLLGSVLPGTRVPRVAGARVLFQGGLALATRVAGRTEWLLPPTADIRAQGSRLLLMEAAARNGGHAGLIASAWVAEAD
jgi:ATP-dependent Lhr-like helicase